MVLATAGLSLALNWPGHLSYDSVLQLAEGRSGSYSGAHPLVMSWLLGLGNALAPGATVFILLQTALIFGALFALLNLGRRIGWACVAVCALCAATPQMLIYPSIVWKDVLFAGSNAAGFAALAWAAAHWRQPAARWTLLGAGGLLVVLATLARQNGAVVLPFAALTVGAVAAMAAGERKSRSGIAYGAAFLAVTGAVAAAGAVALDTRLDPDARPGSTWRALQAYDLVNTLSFAPRTDLPVLRARAPWLEQALRTKGVAAYSPIRADGVEPVLKLASAHGDVAAPLDAQWRDLILTRPLLYLRARLRTFSWVFLTPDHEQCVLIYTGVDGDREDMADAGLTQRGTDWDESLADAAMLLAPTPIYSHAFYAASSLLALAFLLRRRRPADLAVAGMLGAALSFAASFVVISIACDYRYLFALDVAAIAAAIYAAATWRDGVSP